MKPKVDSVLMKEIKVDFYPLQAWCAYVPIHTNTDTPTEACTGAYAHIYVLGTKIIQLKTNSRLSET